MHSRLSRFLRPAASAVAVSALSLSSATSPQAKPGEYVCDNKAIVSGSTFSLHMCNMPDLDQRRAESEPLLAGLPGNGGMYCVPTASMNVVAYIANHGYPGLEPGPGVWKKNDPPKYEYNMMTGHLGDMGAVMGTSASGGTTGDAAEFGLRYWLNGNPFLNTNFVVSQYRANKSYSPRFEDAAYSAIVLKSLVIPIVGWYTNPDSLGAHNRDGGHALTLVHAEGDFDSATGVVGVRDPASPNDGHLLSQSAFTVDYYDVENVVGIFNGYPRVQTRFHGYGSAYMDAYFAVRPKLGLTKDPGNHIKLHLPPDWNDPEAPQIKLFEVPGGKNVVDLAVSPELARHPFLLEHDDTVWQLDLATGATSELAHVAGARRLTFGGPEQNLYVLGERDVVRLDRDGRELGRSRLAPGIDALSFDTRQRQVVVHKGGGDDSLLFLDEALEPLREVRLPIPIPGPPDPTKVSLCVSDLDGTIWLHADGAPSALRVVVDGRGNARVEQIALQGVRAPEGLFVDERGFLFVTDGDVIVELDGNGRRSQTSMFAGRAGTGPIRVLRPFSNFDPATMTGPGFEDVLPTEFGTVVPD